MVLYAWFLHVCSEKIQFAKILCSFERKSVRVCKVGNKKAKKSKSSQFVVQIKVVVQYSLKN